jgi:DNA-binding transcriptional ArsR family regulator
MPNDKSYQKKLHVLTDEAQIKGYVHPLRMSLLVLLATQKRTVSSVAKQLGVHPANITHHFKLLEKVGLIRLVEKRDTGKNLEKYYRAIAQTFEVAPREDCASGALKLSILKNDLAATINTLSDDDSHKVIAQLATARISTDQFDRFCEKLQLLIAEFKQTDTLNGAAYTFNASLYPLKMAHPEKLSRTEVRI